MLSKVTAKNVGDVFFETHCTYRPIVAFKFIVEQFNALILSTLCHFIT